jgi:trimethylamine:corrinoid methyltransferase-like protein
VAGERLKTFSRDVRFAVLDKADEDLIHERSLEVLERAGVSTTNDELLELLELMADHGQQVDVEAKRIYDIACGWVEGFKVRDEDIPVDTIVEVGPTGHFLDQEHTLTNMREIWRDSVMDRRSWDAWEAAERPDLMIAAEEKVRRILAEHEPMPLEPEVSAELDRILAAYEEDAPEG